MLTIGITGTIGAGKGLLVEYLKEKGFEHFSARNFLTLELQKRGMELNRSNMVSLADEIRSKSGPGAMISILVAEANASGKNTVVESIRTLGEVEAFREEAMNPVFFAVDARPEIRYQRILNRGSSTDHISYETFLADDEKEMNSKELWRGNIRGCIEKADFLFENNGSKEEFFIKVEEVFTKLKLEAEFR